MKLLPLLIIVWLLLTVTTLACTIEYENTSNITIFDNLVAIGRGSDCNFTLYFDNKQNQTGEMTKNGLAYSYNAGNLTDGVYSGAIECNRSINSSTSNYYVGECKFEVNNQKTLVRGIDEGLTMFGLFLILVGLAAIYIVAAFKLDEVHIIPKVLLFFAAIINLIADVFLGWLDIRGADIATPLLGMISANLVVFMALLGWWFIFVLKKSANMEKEETDWV